MAVSHNSRQPAQGFTLIEMLVTLVIIGIILTFAVVSYGDFGETRRLKMGQQHFIDLIKLARSKAIISSKTYGINISKQAYSFYQFNAQLNKWLPISDPIFKTTPFIRHKKLNYTHPLSKQTPEIIISPDGELTPFTLELISQSGESIKLEATPDGEISLLEQGSTS